MTVFSGSPATCLHCKYGCCSFGFILGLCLISSFAGFLPVVSCVLIDKWLIINAIHFSGMQVFSGSFCGEERHTLRSVFVWML